MKINKSLVAAGALTILLALPLVGMAVALPSQPVIPTDLRLEGDAGLINKVLSVVWWVFIGIVITFFVIIAVLFLSSQGNPEAIATARRALIWGGAGIIVGVLGFGIIRVLMNTLNITIT